ncbi:MAG TPA: S-adenosylmethionine:tRNA ribosyltransferase-isomerase [Chitinophagaceae bacterium]|nr:S-adenosylmethionine:tRNA ribosyltransferase-isomerase [Chitinophagaceae bacterium]
MHPKHLSINDFIYHLPAEKIALRPHEERDRSKLLIFKQEEIKEDIYKNIADHLPKNSLLIFNNTKVIPARILFRKETGGTIEIFCLEPFVQKDSFGEEEYTKAMSKNCSAEWKCMIGGAGRWKAGTLIKKIKIKEDEIIVTARIKQKLPDAYVTEFSWQPSSYPFSEIIEQAGEIPLPPYIKREVEEDDKERYQTIYAENKGSVAAPTAGLHFTSDIFTSFEKKNIKTDFVTLHVGAGTFKPVKSEIMQEHDMHSEWIVISVSTIENILNNLAENIIAVGTTSLRTIESLYWMGVKSYLNNNLNLDELEIKQWEVYEEPLSKNKIDEKVALTSLLAWMKKNEPQKLLIKTQILIAPGYSFKIANALITNFHQPNSTLLLLVAAITKNWKKLYEYALENDFRFLSYGDGCLIYV